MRIFKKISFLLIFLVLGAVPLLAQSRPGKKWYSGTGMATGKNMEKIHNKALKQARANALEVAGIAINAGKFSYHSSGNRDYVNFFSEFVSTKARGLILKEKDVHFDQPVPLDSTYTIYTVKAHVKVLVGIPKGLSDPAFKVKITSERKTYKEYEPVTLHIKTTESGYLTLLDINKDTINVLFPNSIDHKNYIKANSIFKFPPDKMYSLEFNTDKGTTSSTDLVIAIVTKGDFPFPNINKINVKKSFLTLQEKKLTVYANWLYDIPLNRRCSDEELIHVQK